MARQTLTEHATDIGSVVARNPIPLAMIGIGLGWLAVGAAVKPRRDGASRLHGAAGDGSDAEAADPIVRTASRIEELASSVAEELRSEESDSAADAISRLRHAEQTFSHNDESDAGGSRLDAVREFGGSVYDRAAGYVEEAGDTVRDFGDRVGDMIDRYPLAVGGVAAVVGAILALGLPPTEQEDRMLGNTRDSLRDRALDTGREVLTKAEDTAGRAAAAAIDAAREELEADDPSEMA
jgi:hypothetical protein